MAAPSIEPVLGEDRAKAVATIVSAFTDDPVERWLGRRLLEHGLAIVDQSHLPAYLETPNPRTIPFYERHGFAVTSVSQAGACPPLTSMLREAR